MGAWIDAFRRIAKPRTRLTGSEWADKYRYIAPGTSAEPGPWVTARTPYLREPMDVATDRTHEKMVLMWSSQVGKSELLLNAIGFYADQEPAPQLLLQPTVEAAEAFSKERIDGMFRYSVGLKGKLEEGKEGRGTSRKSTTTIRQKHYEGGYLAMVGANSPAGLASRPIRVLLADEVDRYGTTSEGDPLKLAIQRTTNFHNRKIILVSTPTVSGVSKIEEHFLLSDQRRYHVPCPHCGAAQVLKWRQVKWKKGESGDHLPETAYYECEHCEQPIYDRHKYDMLAAGQWVAEKPENKVAGFHLNSLYSPWVKFSALAAEWVEVNAARDRKGQMEFINLKLGEPWVEDREVIAHDHLLKRREYYDTDVPEGVLFLTAGVDIQDNRIECEVVGWGHGRESWGIEYRVFFGSPEQQQVWRELDTYLASAFTTHDGHSMRIGAAAVDTGYLATEVYNFCKAREGRRIFAIKGGRGQIPFINNPTYTNVARVALFTLGVSNGKATILSRVKLESEGPGYCHFPRESERGYDEEYFKGLLAEKMKYKYRNGKTEIEWEIVHKRNEPLDLRNYATAALEIINPDFAALEALRKGGAPAQGGQPRPRRRARSSQGVQV